MAPKLCFKPLVTTFPEPPLKPPHLREAPEPTSEVVLLCRVGLHWVPLHSILWGQFRMPSKEEKSHYSDNDRKMLRREKRGGKR